MKTLMNEKLYHELKKVGESAVLAERITGGFAKNFNDLFERSKVRKGDLAVASNISDKTLWRLRNDENYQPALQTLIAVCVGMKLSFPEAMVLIELSPYRLRHTKFQDAIYTHILHKSKEASVEEINICLEALKCEKIGKVM